MGTSGSGAGGGGSGGAGSGGGGSHGAKPPRGRARSGSGGYGDYNSSGTGSSQKDGKGTSAKRNIAQTVLGNLKPAYLGQQFAGAMPTGLVHELVLLKTDITVNRSWKSMCARLGLPANASPADVRDKIVTRQASGESDSRIRETATATVLYFFEELCRFDDRLLYEKGGDSTLGALNQGVINRPLETFLRLHYINILQREEPKLLNSKAQTGLENVAAAMASVLERRLRHRYGSKDQSSEGDFLKRAGTNDEERTWLLTAIRG